MSRLIIVRGVVVAILLFVGTGWVHAQPEESEAERVVRRAFETYGGEDSFSRLDFSFEAERGKPSRISLVMGFKRGAAKGDVDYKIIMFNEFPPDQVDVGFLGWFYRGNAGMEDEMWLYLPELRQIRRLVHNHGADPEAMGHMRHDDASDEFSASQLNHEELMPRWPGLDNHRLLGMEDIDGKPVYMIESVPRDPVSSAYGKRIQWITQDEALPVRIAYYDEELVLLKTQTLTWRRLGDAWVWDRVTAVNNITGAKTLLEQSDVQLNLGLPDSLFTKRALSLGGKAFESRVRKSSASRHP